jgi:nucleoside-diphosphate-sugar epimerase
LWNLVFRRVRGCHVSSRDLPWNLQREGEGVKTILLTGASGRIGRHVVPLLLDRGYSVRAMMRRPNSGESWLRQVEVVSAGLPGSAGLNAAVSGTDAIIHLAGIMPPASDDEVFHTNIEGTFNILQAAATMEKKPRVLFASSDATYCTGWSLSAYSAPIREDAEQHPSVFYGLSKVLGERMCLYYAELHKIPIVRLRFVWTLEAQEILDLFLKAPYRDFLVDLDRQVWDEAGIIALPHEENGTPFTEHVCDVRDAAEATVLALESDSAVGEAFNIAGPEAFRYTEIAPDLVALTGLRAVDGRCRGIHSYSLSIEKAQSLLGYRPKFKVMDSLRDALAKAEKA